MPSVWSDEPAARLANVLDLSTAQQWDAAAPVLALLHHPPGDLGSVRLHTQALDGPIPLVLAACAPGEECLALGLSSVFAERPARARGKARQETRMTVAVSDTTAVVVYRHRSGLVRRTEEVGPALRAHLHALWRARVQHELRRPS